MEEKTSGSGTYDLLVRACSMEEMSPAAAMVAHDFQFAGIAYLCPLWDLRLDIHCRTFVVCSRGRDLRRHIQKLTPTSFHGAPAENLPI